MSFVRAVGRGHGRAVVSWSEYKSGRWRYRATRLRSSGLWEEPLTVAGESDDPYYTSAVSPTGRLAIAWSSRGELWLATTTARGRALRPIRVAPAVEGEYLRYGAWDPAIAIDWVGKSELAVGWLVKRDEITAVNARAAIVSPTGVVRQELAHDDRQLLETIDVRGDHDGTAVVMWGGPGTAAGVASRRPGSDLFERADASFIDTSASYLAGGTFWRGDGELFSLWGECPSGEPDCWAIWVSGSPFTGGLTSERLAMMTDAMLVQSGDRVALEYGSATAGDADDGVWLRMGDTSGRFDRPRRLLDYGSFEGWVALTKRGRAVVLSDTQEGELLAWVVSGRRAWRLKLRETYYANVDLAATGGERIIAFWSENDRLRARAVVAGPSDR